MSETLLYYMWLTIAFSPSNPRKWDALEKYDSVQSFYKNMKSNLHHFTQLEQSSLISSSLAQAQAMIDYCHSKKIKIYTYEDSAFPQQLRDINNSPSVIFSLGDLESACKGKSVAIVGSREADNYSAVCTTKIASLLAQNNVCIISGFAKGIDSAAHNGALSAGGKTIAVLGCGVEYDYPKNSLELKSKISKSGAVISEYFPATRPCPENFKIRNRIVSALSDAVLCTQASIKSGALNTASHALVQGKEIIVTPPHDILSEKYAGIISLLRDGATQIYSAQDILSLLTDENYK